MIGLPGRLIIAVVHRLASEVAQEWQQLDGKPVSFLPPVVLQEEEMSCTGATIERAPSWDHDSRRPAVANRVGFSLPVCMIPECYCDGTPHS